MTTITQTITTLPAAPDPATMTPTQFSTAAAAYVLAQKDMVPELNTWAGQVNTVAGEVSANAIAAAADAVLAEAASDAAIAVAGADLWVSGQSYALGDAAISPINLKTYRANTTTSGTTDPSLSADWTSTAPAAGAMTYISTVNASGASTVDIEGFDPTYDKYIITAENVTCGSDSSVSARVKIAGAYVTTSTYNWHLSIPNSSSTSYASNAGASQTSIRIIGGLGSAGVASWTTEIHSPAGTVNRKIINTFGGAIDGNGYMVSTTGAGTNSGTGAVTGLQFIPGSGTLTGTFRLYGIKNS